MSNLIIKIVAIDNQTAKSAKGKDYRLVEVTYKNMSFQGKVETKKHNEFGDKAVFDVLRNASAGEEYTITRTKDDNGYWQWVGITEGSAAPTQNVTSSAPAAKATTGGGNWETPEERAKRQVYIIKQSSLGHAIETLKTDKKSPTKDEVLQLAQDYTNWVLGQKVSLVNELPVEESDEDVPY